MTKRIYLEFRSSVRLHKNIDALPVSLTIYDEVGRLEGKNSFLSVMPDLLRSSFQKWQQYISPKSQDPTVRRIRFQPKSLGNKAEIDRHNINFEQIANEFKINLDRWLNAGWCDEKGDCDFIIKKTLESYYLDREEVQIFIQTDDRELRGLPWQEWEILQEFFTIHSDTELSISSTNFKRPQRAETLLADARIRILAIFGDEKLDLTEEKTLITNLEKYGGTICILNQPNRSNLERALQDSNGWHILFFAGHSGSNEHGNLGWIENQPGEKIAIEELNDLLQKLIQDKLQLAIFNSCDGLGLANQLVSLSLPYCIVMREPVESTFARELLRHLLIAFIRGKSLFAAMRYAREYLRQEFDEKGKHPGKSWLPVIVANPEAQLLTWDGMFTERRLDRKWELLLFALLLVAVFGLPLSILIEFGSVNTLILYARLYPQIVIYPSLMLGISLYALYRAVCLIRQKAKIFWSFTLAVFLFSCVSVSLDLNRDPLLLFELKPQAITVVKSHELTEITQAYKISKDELKKISKHLLNASNLFNAQGDMTIEKQQIEASIGQLLRAKNKSVPDREHQSYHNLLKIALQNKIWSSTNETQFSVSRWFYAFSYFSIFFCMTEIFTLIFQSILSPTAVFKQNKYISYLIICETGTLTWLAFYSYYIQKTKPFLLDSQFDPHFTNITPFIYIFIFMFSLLLLTLWVVKLQINTQKYRRLFSGIVIFISILTVAMSICGVPLIDRMFGISTDNPSISWGGTIAIFYFLYFIIISSIDSKAMKA
jgi:CHAT domain